MKIHFSFDRFRFFIWLPYCLFFNRLVSLIISKVLKEAGMTASVKSVRSSMKEVRKEIKRNKRLTVFQIKSANGFEMAVNL